MGKYIRKPKSTNDVAVKDVTAQSYLGVRTRAKTLALQRLQSAADAKPDFLELRSRRLEKPPLLRRNFQNSRKAPAPKKEFVCRDEGNPQFESSTGKIGPEPAAVPIEPVKEGDGCCERANGGFEVGDMEIEASLGENNLELEARERGTRESTPCSLIRTADSISTPGSSTRPRSPIIAGQMTQNVPRDLPTTHELDEFFAQVEQPLQRRFIEKYNYDIVNDVPLPPGRYEWVKVMP